MNTMSHEAAVKKIFDMFADRGITGPTRQIMALISDLADLISPVVGTREAVIVNDRTGYALLEVDPIAVPINRAGQAVDSGAIDAVLDATGPGYHAVWLGTRDAVICAD